MKSILDIILFFIDFRHKSKIINFFKNQYQSQSLVIIDVGAHEGETINLISKNFNIKKMICYEASKINFNKLNKFKNNQNLNLIVNNIALGSNENELEFHQTSESSSSTFCKIDQKKHS